MPDFDPHRRLLDAGAAIDDDEDWHLVGPEGRIVWGSLDGARAVALWETLAHEHPSTGHWPVLLGPSVRRLGLINENLESGADGPGLDALVAESWAVDVRAWLDGQRARFAGSHPRATDEALHRFPTVERLRAGTDRVTGNHRPDIPIGLVRAGSPSDAVLALRLGGGIASFPPLPVMAAVLRMWGDSHGAVPAEITHDSVECAVARPVADEAGALAVARDMAAFCPDIVTGGTETVGRLAGAILGSRAWFLRWD